MSYARFSEGDVYVFPHVDGHFEYHECRLGEEKTAEISEGVKELLDIEDDNATITTLESFKCDTRQEMIDHLNEHIEHGHHVPDRAIERLKEEI
jgi:hypothetical protein